MHRGALPSFVCCQLVTCVAAVPPSSYELVCGCFMGQIISKASQSVMDVALDMRLVWLHNNCVRILQCLKDEASPVLLDAQVRLHKFFCTSALVSVGGVRQLSRIMRGGWQCGYDSDRAIVTNLVSRCRPHSPATLWTSTVTLPSALRLRRAHSRKRSTRPWFLSPKRSVLLTTNPRVTPTGLVPPPIMPPQRRVWEGMMETCS